MQFFIKKSKNSVQITPLNDKSYKKWLNSQDAATKNWAKDSEFSARPNQLLLVPDKSGNVKEVLFGVGENINTFTFASLPTKLPFNKSGYFINDKFDKDTATKVSIGWALGCYKFKEYKKDKENNFNPLVMPDKADEKKVLSTIKSTFMVRDLINTPANDMGPAEIVAAAKKVAKNCKTKLVVGEDLIKKNFPAVYEVGKGSARKPRLIEFTWGNAKHPKVTLVGKGVAFDTGGLDLKTPAGMALMKKDMGGAAHVLGVASMIIDNKLPVRLRVIIPAVENSVSGNSYRPSDVIKTRKGISVEIGNTDAEGRLILADGLALACEDNPDLVIDFATLTGAARVALGPDLPPIFSNNDKLAQQLQKVSAEVDDPVWQLPLWSAYADMLNSDIADINNSAESGFAGAITAALFLNRFVNKDTDWIHIDTFGWCPSNKPGKPKGGEALGMRAVYKLIEEKFSK